MALPVLDGNQSATTLSSVVTGGEHIVAHSVVCFGSTAISNITNAISGSVVSVSNFPSTQTIAGTVTANMFGRNANYNSGITALQLPIIGFDETIETADAGLVIPVQITNTLGVVGGSNALPISGTVTIGSLPAISGTVTANMFGFSESEGQRQICVLPGDVLPTDIENHLIVRPRNSASDPLAISGTVTVGNSVTIGSLPAISGTVTANGIAVDTTNPSYHYPIPLSDSGEAVIVDVRGGFGQANVPISGTVTVGNSVTIGSLPAISGTVTVGNNNFNIKTVIAQDGSANFTAFNGTQFRLYTPTGASKTLNNIFGSTPSWVVAFSDSVTWFSDSGTQVAYFHDGTQWTLDDFTTPAGTLALDGSVFITNLSSESSINLLNGFTAAQLGSAYVNGSGALRVSLYSSTVTAAAPNGSLTTRFGTPTTANTAFATSAVTNANRKYLLIQNVTTGSNVITVGIGFTPTTTQGIQLTAGGGITFESSYIPTGAVYVLSSVTASNFTILEA